MASWALFFDRQGNLLDEYPGSFSRAWKLSAVSECNFTIHVNDPHFTKRNFTTGNFLAIYHDGGLKPWVGNLDLPQKWGSKLVKIKAFSAENIFNRRTGPVAILPYFETGPGGTVYKKLVKLANEQEDALLTVGDVYLNDSKNVGTEISPATSLMTNLLQILKTSREDYDITPQVINNKLVLLANWYKRRGQTINDGLNDSNCKIIDDALTVKGPIWNQVFGYDGSGETTTSYTARDEASIKEHGLFAKPLSVSSGDQAVVTATAEREVLTYAWPKNLFAATVTYNKATIQKLIDLGNQLPFENADAGFGAGGRVGVDAWVRIFGIAYSDGDSEVTLTLNKES